MGDRKLEIGDRKPDASAVARVSNFLFQISYLKSPVSNFLPLLFLLLPLASSASPVRVASLAPSLTEMICDLGFVSNLVGRSSACDFPPASQSVPVVGDFGRPTLEAVMAAHPDLLVVTDVENASTLDAVRASGVRVQVLPCESWSNLAAAASVLARELGDPAGGSNWVARLDARRAALAQRIAARPGPPPRVFVEVWGEPLTTAGREAFLCDVIRTAGGVNVGQAMAGRYVTVGTEWVIEQNPDVILLTYMPASSAPDVKALAARVGWADLKAVKSGAVIRNLSSDLLLRPGPRLIEGTEQLADALDKLR